MTWAPGARIDRFVLEDRLGAGGMGEVFAARDEETGARYALKTLPATTEAELLLRFQREGEAQARGGAHPNVVRVHSTGQAAGRHYLVMELAEGGALDARLRSGPLAPREAAALVRELAEGLAWMHAQGVLHRDLKPANVLFNAGGTPKLVDFGLARVVDAQTLTQTGTLLGTPAYMAPEQARGEAVDQAADVYGLGAVLYACLTGVPPFSGSSPMAVLVQVNDEPPRPVRSLAPDCPAALAALCEQCLAKSPEKRPASASALAEQLQVFLDGRARRSLPVGGLAAAIAIALVLALGLTLTRAPPEIDAVTEVSSTTSPAPTPEAKSAGPPAWYYELDPHQRPPLPLPNALVFSPTYGRYVNLALDAELVWVPPARFTLGDESVRYVDGSPVPVSVSGFFIGRLELSTAQVNRYRRAKGIKLKKDNPAHGWTQQHPGRVTWAEASALCAWAGLRLPTEPEWELAAGGPDEHPYPWGDAPPNAKLACWGKPDVPGALATVTSHPRGVSPVGCLNMAGNVAEWTQEFYMGSYDFRTASEDLVNQPGHVRRGGGYTSPAKKVRTFERSSGSAGEKNGIRVVCSPTQEVLPIAPQDERSGLQLFNLATGLRREERYLQALKMLNAAIPKLPTDGRLERALKERASLRFRLGDMWGSEADWTRVIALHPKRAYYWRERAGLRANVMRLDEASEDLNAFDALDSQDEGLLKKATATRELIARLRSLGRPR